jgi:hypothetical protein
MPLYEITSNDLLTLEATSFEAAGVKERVDLQRLLREQIEVIAPDALVISEEFSEWDDSKRRIDLLAVDTDANLVVIELKRTGDGGHMELQAIRYAAMVSAMTFDRAADVYAAYLARTGKQLDARASLLEFLEWDAPDDDQFAQDVRIVLASADFSKELTTAVLWLNTRGVDIRCVRLKPYRRGDATLIDVQQIIPLPEAEEYQIQVRAKEQQARSDRAERHDLRYRFFSALLARAKDKTSLHAHVSPSDAGWVSASAGVSGFSYVYVALQKQARVELYIDLGETAACKAAFDALLAQKDSIESDFGAPLKWERLDGKRACRISYTTPTGGYRSDEADWSSLHDEMIDTMIRFERALGSCLRQSR